MHAWLFFYKHIGQVRYQSFGRRVGFREQIVVSPLVPTITGCMEPPNTFRHLTYLPELLKEPIPIELRR